LALLNDIHHLTFITADLDRLIAFYERVFGAQVTLDLEEECLRHAFIKVGPHTVLHPFQVSLRHSSLHAPRPPSRYSKVSWEAGHC